MRLRGRPLRSRTAAFAALAAASALLAGGAAVAADPPSTPTRTWVASGPQTPGLGGTATVNAIAVSGPTAYLAGNFRYLGPESGSFVVLDEGSGAAVSGWPVTNGSVAASAPDGSGGWFIGGTFSYVGGLPRTNLAHILSDGSVDPAWAPTTNKDVSALAISGSRLYVGGNFTVVNGFSSKAAAALDIVSGALTPWNPALSGVSPPPSVMALAVAGSTVYLGGLFSTVSGMTRHNLAAVDATSGLATGWDPNVGSIVYGLAVAGSTVYAVGAFATVNGSTTRHGAAAFAATTGVATQWNPDLGTGLGRAVAVDGATVYIGGTFPLVNGSTLRSGIAGVNATTGIATAWSPNVGGAVTVFSIAVDGAHVAVGGRFGSIGAAGVRDNIAILEAATGVATAFAPVVGGDVMTVQMSGATVFAGGMFQSVGGLRRSGLAALDLSLGKATGWAPAPDPPPQFFSAIAVSGSSVYVGFPGTIPGRRGLAAYNASTAVLEGWDPSLLSGGVNAIAVSGSTVYVGGGFGSVNFVNGVGSVTRNNLAAFDAVHGTATAWNPNVNGIVNALAVSGSTVWAGGAFTTVNGGIARNRGAAFDAATGTETGWSPNPNGAINALAVDGPTVYAGGAFTTVNGTKARNRIAAFDAATGTATDWDPNLDDTATEIAVSGSTVLAAGSFSAVNGGAATRPRLAAFAATTGDATDWNPIPDDAVNAIVSAGGPLVAGAFTSFGSGATAQAGIGLFAPVGRVITATGTALVGAQNHELSGAVATFTIPSSLPDAGEFAASIDWGDGRPPSDGAITGGNGSFSVAGSHTYTSPGHHDATVTIADGTDASNVAVVSTGVDVTPEPRRVDSSLLPPPSLGPPPATPDPPPPTTRPPLPPH